MPDNMSEQLKKTMPYDSSAEKAVIGAMFIDEDAIALAQEDLKQDDFYLRNFGFVYEAMCNLYNEGKVADPTTVRDRLVKMEVDPSISEMSFLNDLYDSAITSANIKEYSKIVKEKSVLRKTIRVCQEIENKCFKGSDELDDILEFAESNVYGLADNEGTGEYKDISKIVIEALESLEETAKNKGGVKGIPTGFTDLDRMTNGLQRSDLILIAARPSMGKTAFALNIAQYAAIRAKQSVAIFSLEMSKDQLVNRILALDGQVKGTKLRNGELSDDDWARLVMSSSALGNSRLILDDTPGLSPSLLRSKCRKYKAMHGLDLIIIDYLQLMEGDKKSGRKGENRQQEISEISRALKLIAREINVPVIALSQLSRAVEQRDDHHPRLSDLRESGAIEQDADVVMFLYREWVYDKENGNRNAAEVDIAKQRNGPIGSVNLTWLEDYTKFENAAKDNF